MYTEYLPVGGIYHCYLYSAVTFGYGDTFRVEDIPTGWQTFFNGYAELPNPVSVTQMGFSSGNSFARGEVGWTSNKPTFDVTWGSSGQTHWQFKTDSGGCCTTYTDVDSYANGTSWDKADSQDSDNDWNVGSSSADPPSPFDIKWIG